MFRRRPRSRRYYRRRYPLRGAHPSRLRPRCRLGHTSFMLRLTLLIYPAARGARSGVGPPARSARPPLRRRHRRRVGTLGRGDGGYSGPRCEGVPEADGAPSPGLRPDYRLPARPAAASAPSLRSRPFRPARHSLRPRPRRGPVRGREGPRPLRRERRSLLSADGAGAERGFWARALYHGPRRRLALSQGRLAEDSRCAGLLPDLLGWRGVRGRPRSLRGGGAPDTGRPLRRDALAAARDSGPSLPQTLPARPGALPLWPRRLQGRLRARWPDPLEG